MVTKQSKENEVYMKKTTLEEKLGYNQKGAKKELKMEPIERQIYYIKWKKIQRDGIITVLIEWKGFYHKLAQRFFHRPRVSEIKLDKLGTFVWNSIDDKKDVHAISKELEAEFPSMEQPLTRLIKYLEILHDNHLIYWKGEKRK